MKELESEYRVFRNAIFETHKMVYYKIFIHPYSSIFSYSINYIKEEIEIALQKWNKK